MKRKFFVKAALILSTLVCAFGLFACGSGLTAEAPTVLINPDGYWVINDVVTDVKAAGENGKDGSSWKAAYGMPDDSYGVDGDLYINLNDYAIYVKSDGAWVIFNNDDAVQRGTEGLTYRTVKENGVTVGYEVRGIGTADDIDIVIPSSYKGKPVTSIGEITFNGCGDITSIEIPNSVTSIGRSAFGSCSGLTSIVIPDSVTSIGSGAVYNCNSLTSIEIPNSVTSIGSEAFSGCSGLTSIEIPNSVTWIGSEAFSGCSGLTSIEIPNSVTWIGRSAFDGCDNLTIYCEAESKPSGWDSYWNPNNHPLCGDIKEISRRIEITCVKRARKSKRKGNISILSVLMTSTRN